MLLLMSEMGTVCWAVVRGGHECQEATSWLCSVCCHRATCQGPGAHERSSPMSRSLTSCTCATLHRSSHCCCCAGSGAALSGHAHSSLSICPCHVRGTHARPAAPAGVAADLHAGAGGGSCWRLRGRLPAAAQVCMPASRWAQTSMVPHTVMHGAAAGQPVPRRDLTVL